MRKAEKNSILIIDDEPANIIALRQILSPEYIVYGATDGQTGITAARTKSPDIILLDIIMPYMDGYEILAILKKTKETHNIPVVFITGLSGEIAEEKGLDLGADDYILKPFNSANIKLRVRNLIKTVNRTHTINERLRQQALMTRISHSFVSDIDLETLLTDSLRMVGEFMDVAYVLLYKIEDERNTLSCKNEWLNPELDLKSRIGKTIELDENIDEIISKMFKSEDGYACLHSNNPDHKEAMKPLRKSYECFITTPIFIKGKMSALLDFARDDDGHKWDESEIDLAVLVSDVFSGAFEREAMEDDLNVVLKLQSELVTAKEIAEQSNRAKSEFLSRMSHEMLTPMNAILGMTQLAMMSKTPDKIGDCLDEVNKASRHLLTMIHDVLDLSGGSSAFSLVSECFSANAMVKYILSRVNPELEKKQQKLLTDVSEDIPKVLVGDEKRITRVILHMLSNAIKFSPEKSDIHLNIYVHEEKDNEITLKIEIADNGIGMSEDEKNNLFDLFEQADGSNNRKYGGIGIGLPLSRSIVEMLGGEIWVDSEPEKGTKFTFTCKVKKDE